MNELSTNFYSNCNIGSFKPQPIPRAADPSNPPAPVSSPIIPLLQNPFPRAERGRGRRSKQSLVSLIPSKPQKLTVASFSPLCLPFNGLPNQLKPPTTKLERLSHKCVRRFLVSALSLSDMQINFWPLSRICGGCFVFLPSAVSHLVTRGFKFIRSGRRRLCFNCVVFFASLITLIFKHNGVVFQIRHVVEPKRIVFCIWLF